MSRLVFLFRSISVGLVIFSLVQPSVMMAMKQGIEDADTVALRNYMNAHPVEQEEFMQRVLKENHLKNKIPGHKFTGPEDNFPLKNYEVVVDFLRDKRDFAFLNDEVSLDAAFGLTKLLVKRGFYPLAAQGAGAAGTLDEFRTEALAALTEVIHFEGPKSWTFHSYLWRAVINMDGYKKGVWGPQNAPLNEAWDDLQEAEKLRNEFNLSKSVYLWMALLVAESGHRPLMVLAGEDIEVYHKTKAQEWFDIYKEARPAAAQAVAPLMQQALAAAALAPVAAAPQIDDEDIKQSSARTDYKNELKDQEKRLKEALENWQPGGAAVGVPPAPPAPPAPGNGEDEGDEDQPPHSPASNLPYGNGDEDPGPASEGGSNRSAGSPPPSLPSSDREEERDDDQGPVVSMAGIQGSVAQLASAPYSPAGPMAMDETLDLFESDEEGPVFEGFTAEEIEGTKVMGINSQSEFEEKEIYPSKNGKRKRIIESSDEEESWATPNGKGEMREPEDKEKSESSQEKDEGEKGQASSSASPVHKKKRVFLNKATQAKRDEEIVRLRRAGLSYGQIEEQMKADYSNISKAIIVGVLERKGLTSKEETPRMSQEVYEEKRQIVFSLYREMLERGETPSRKVIQEKTGLSNRQVSRIVEAYRKEKGLKEAPRARGEEAKEAKRKPILDMYKAQVAVGKPDYAAIAAATGAGEQYIARVITEAKKEGTIDTYLKRLTASQKTQLIAFISQHKGRSDQEVADLFNAQNIEGMPEVLDHRVKKIRLEMNTNK